MRLTAYILAADPAWIEASVLSYYDIVERIVVSYDENGRGYTGHPVALDDTLTRLKAIDRNGKLDLRPGHYARTELWPMDCETLQRKAAIAQASVDAGWVLQLDTDELLPDSQAFLAALDEATGTDRLAVDFPSLWLYSWEGRSSFLSWCGRFARVDVRYPGSMAVRSGVDLSFGRRSVQTPFHVNIRPVGQCNGNAIDSNRIVRMDQSIIHLSMVRSFEQLQQKFSTWSHSKDRDWSPELECWKVANRHPRLAAVVSQFDLSTRARFLWPVTLTPQAMRLLEASPVDLENMRQARSKPMSLREVAVSSYRGWVKPAAERIDGAIRKRLGKLRPVTPT